MSCGSEVGVGGGATEEKKEKEEELGVSEQKQKPHTKMWGKTRFTANVSKWTHHFIHRDCSCPGAVDGIAIFLAGVVRVLRIWVCLETGCRQFQWIVIIINIIILHPNDGIHFAH